MSALSIMCEAVFPIEIDAFRGALKHATQNGHRASHCRFKDHVTSHGAHTVSIHVS